MPLLIKPKRGSMVKDVVAMLKENKSIAEIVSKVGCSPATVKVQMGKLKREVSDANNQNNQV
jgi:DNA-binding CsgD family transcriptional regulator